MRKFMMYVVTSITRFSYVERGLPSRNIETRPDVSTSFTPQEVHPGI